jgi:hypothetical protein
MLRFSTVSILNSKFVRWSNQRVGESLLHCELSSELLAGPKGE